jgi:hypothetical protein
MLCGVKPTVGSNPTATASIKQPLTCEDAGSEAVWISGRARYVPDRPRNGRHSSVGRPSEAQDLMGRVVVADGRGHGCHHSGCCRPSRPGCRGCDHHVAFRRGRRRVRRLPIRRSNIALCGSDACWPFLSRSASPWSPRSSWVPGAVTWSKEHRSSNLGHRPIPRDAGEEVGIGCGGRRGPSRSAAACSPAEGGRSLGPYRPMSSAALSAAWLGPRSARSRLNTSIHWLRASTIDSATRWATLWWRPRVMAT